MGALRIHFFHEIFCNISYFEDQILISLWWGVKEQGQGKNWKSTRERWQKCCTILFSVNVLIMTSNSSFSGFFKIYLYTTYVLSIYRKRERKRSSLFHCCHTTELSSKRSSNHQIQGLFLGPIFPDFSSISQFNFLHSLDYGQSQL